MRSIHFDPNATLPDEIFPPLKKRFVIGVDRSKMRLYDVNESEQTLMDDTPVFDKTPTGKAIIDEKAFEGFKL